MQGKQMEELANKKCVPCQISVPPIKEAKAREMLKSFQGWELIENSTKIQRKYKFRDFSEAMQFINKVAEIAEQEGHHPDILVSYSRVTITNYTHKINGLHENDFILAAKIDGIRI